MNKCLNGAIAAILTTAIESEPTVFPESYGYIAVGSDLEKWNAVKGVLSRAALATFDGNQIRLTDKGRLLAQQCQAVLQPA